MPIGNKMIINQYVSDSDCFVWQHVCDDGSCVRDVKDCVTSSGKTYVLAYSK